MEERPHIGIAAAAQCAMPRAASLSERRRGAEQHTYFYTSSYNTLVAATISLGLSFPFLPEEILCQR